MKLEVIAAGRATATRPTPLLLVHGAWHGAWAWQDGFSDALAAAGYAVYAVSLRGHGGSDGRERLRATRIADYVADVLAVSATLPTAPVLIGHSMGGLVVQKTAERHPTPALVLLAPVPTSGALAAALNYKGRIVIASDGTEVPPATRCAGGPVPASEHAGTAMGSTGNDKKSAVWNGASTSAPCYQTAVSGALGAYAQTGDATSVGSPGF